MSGAAQLPEAPALDPDQQSRIEAQQRQQEAVFHKDRVGLDVFDLFYTVQINIHSVWLLCGVKAAFSVIPIHFYYINAHSRFQQWLDVIKLQLLKCFTGF